LNFVTRRGDLHRLRRGPNRNIAVSIDGRNTGEQLMAVDKPFTVYAPGLAGVPVKS
jgi:hypothetical protein